MNKIKQENMPNYNNGKIYNLVNNIDNNIYIGSSCNVLSKRLSEHKRNARIKTERQVYKHLNEIGWLNVKIILIEEFACENRNQLLWREDYFIRLMKPSLNKYNAVFSLCIHKKRKHNCIECGGSSICEHKKKKNIV